MRARHSAFLVITVAALLCALGIASAASASSGELDPTFGSGGSISTSLGGLGPQTKAIEVQPDGKIVVAGMLFGSESNAKQLVMRFNSNGSPDTGFGSGGIREIDYATDNLDIASDVAIGADGAIVLVGSADQHNEGDSTITRLLSDGTPDPDFGTGGKKRISLGDASTSDYAAKVAVRPDGRILVLASILVGGQRDVELIQLTKTGAYDPGFINGGSRTFSFPTAAVPASDDLATDLKLLGDGKIVLLASNETGVSTRGIVLKRLNSTGGDDPSFAGGAEFTLDIGQADSVDNLVVQASGKAVVAYNVFGGTGRVIKAIRVQSDGSGIDGSFGAGGTFTLALPNSDFVLIPGAQTPDGGLLYAGRDDNTNGLESAYFLRLTADGQPVGSFGSGGFLTSFAHTTVGDLAVLPNGKYLALASSSGPTMSLIQLIGDFVAPPAATVPLATTIKSPSKSKSKASKLKTISGTATGTGLSKVEFAIQKLDSKLLKKSKRCRYVTGSKGKTKKYKASKKKCAPKKYLTAKGTTSWSYKIKLKPGKYKLTVRAVGAGGLFGKASVKNFKLTK
jgi:uncharacterized delta-60 repeat protein